MLRRWWGDSSSSIRGVPYVAFICSGVTTFVVTTSHDRWNGMSVMYEFSGRCRAHRVATNPGPFRPMHTNVPGLSQRLFQELDPLRPPHLEQKRRNVINQDKWAPTRRHLSETARCFACPSFEPMARCLRCQALFRYNLPVEVTNLERILREQPRKKVIFDWECAEAFAHYFCEAAKGGFDNH
jgi:hypothetical protein